MKKCFYIGNKLIGDSSILLQSMGDRKTSDVNYAIKLTNDLEKMGLDMMRFSILDKEDAISLKKIKEKVSIPIIADIHFDLTLAFLAIENGADKIRINPGNTSTSLLNEFIALVKEKDIPIRIGVNSGSLNKYLTKTSDFEEAYFLALDEVIDSFKSLGFDKLVLSLKNSDVKKTYSLYTKAYARYPYPLHLGLTESGFSTSGVIRSTIAMYPLIKDRMCSTIRLSLADERKEEVRALKVLLKEAGIRSNLPTLIVCPTCGRTQVDVKELARVVQNKLDYVFKDVKIAIMGCPVNGIGEGKDADFGLAGSGKKDIYVAFKKGKSIGLYNRDDALSLLDQFLKDF